VIDKTFQRRVINWARASRPSPRSQPSPTQAIINWLKLYSPAVKEEGEAVPEQAESTPIDFRDARLLDLAYRSPNLRSYQKQLLVNFYIYQLSPITIERRLLLPPKTFDKYREQALNAFEREVEAIEEKTLDAKAEMSDNNH
jgi:hypothetical protein